jgi:hypothetical protein
MEQLHPALQKAVDAAVEKTKGSKGGPTNDQLAKRIKDLQDVVDTFPDLLAQARQQVKDELLGGAGAAFDTLKELQERFATDETAATALANRIGSVEQKLPTLALAADVATSLAGKANATTVQTISTTVNSLSAEMGNKLGKNNDMATGLMLAAESNSLNSAVRMSQLEGGIRRPYFIFKNLGSTPQQADKVLQNPFPDALTYQPTEILCYVVTRPGLAATVTVSYLPPGGGAAVMVYSRLITPADALASGVIDLVNPKMALPEVPIGARFQAVATAGTYKVIINGLLQ